MTRRLEVLAAAAALRNFTVAELAAYTRYGEGTVRKILNREQAQHGWFVKDEFDRPAVWRVKEMDRLLEEISREPEGGS